MSRRAAALAFMIAATVAAPGLAAPRVLLYVADDTPQLRAARAGVREALAATAVEEIPAADAGARLKAATRESGDVALVTLGPDAAARAAHDAPMLPAVDCMASQAAPGGTAVPVAIPSDLQVTWLLRLLPGARYIGILYDPAQSTHAVEALAAALRRADLNPVLLAVPTTSTLPAALARMSAAADALVAVPDSTVYSRQTAKELLLFSFRHKLPLIGLSEPWVEAGALFALDWDYRELGIFCGRLALQRLAGRDAEAPPPPRVHVFVNQRSARRFGLQWDDALRRSVDRVVE